MLLAYSAPNFVLVQGGHHRPRLRPARPGTRPDLPDERFVKFAGPGRRHRRRVPGQVAPLTSTLTTGSHWCSPSPWPPPVGGLCEILLRRLFTRPRVLVMVATIGLSQVLLALAILPFIKPPALQASAGSLRHLIQPRLGHHSRRGRCSPSLSPRSSPLPWRWPCAPPRGGFPCAPCRRMQIQPGSPVCGSGVRPR